MAAGPDGELLGAVGFVDQLAPCSELVLQAVLARLSAGHRAHHPPGLEGGVHSIHQGLRGPLGGNMGRERGGSHTRAAMAYTRPPTTEPLHVALPLKGSWT